MSFDKIFDLTAGVYFNFYDINLNLTMVHHSVRKSFLLYPDWVMHAIFAKYATLANHPTLGVIFHVFLALLL